MLIRCAASLLFILSVTACGREAEETSGAADYDPGRDYFTFANTSQFESRHLELDLDVDFERQTLSGHVIHEMACIDPGASQVVLDSRGLVIDRVRAAPAGGTARELRFRLSESDPVRGEALWIDLPDGFDCAREFQLKIEYRTGPDASAIMWLPPELTAGGDHPFMFTQSQSIHARSWVPLQDTPSVRITYEATIRTPAQLLAVMSADNDPEAPRTGQYHFLMPQPIPSYLLALAVGNIYFEPFGEDTGVYAEPEVLPAAAWEFADTQAMLDAAEAIYGPYQWGRYDLLILPPSFPYGGMENPRLSFITPSLLAGDRSLVSVIAHELAHSWSGNLVSNRTWRDIWLNEGTTSYLEARLMEVLYGRERANEERVLVYQSLLEDLERLPREMQPLAPVFTTGDPDVGQDGMEYAKGQMLLEHLEAVFGRQIFDAFMAGYFDHFAFQAISTEQFLEYADRELLRAVPGRYTRDRLEEWLYQPGLPDERTVPRSANLEAASAAAPAWVSGERLVELDGAWAFSSSTNAEVARAWFIEVARRRFEPAYDRMRQYLGMHGRTRLVKPVYEALTQNGEDRALALEIFNGASSTYHPLTRAAIEPLFDGGGVE